MKLLRSVILIALVVTAYGVARVSSKEELKRLARLPKIQFSPALEFQRYAGFIVFPDSSAVSAEIANIQKKLRDERGNPALYLQLGRLYDQIENHAYGIRFYTRAIDQFRRKLEVDPNSSTNLAGLAEALCAVGNFREALPNLQKAVAAEERSECWLAFGEYHKERAWRTLAGEEHLFGKLSFSDALEEVVENGVDATKLEEARRDLDAAVRCYNKAVELDPKRSEPYARRAVFHAFASVMRAALAQAQSSAPDSEPLRKRLTPPEAIADLNRAAALAVEDPSLIAAAAFVPFFAAASDLTDPEAVPNLGKSAEDISNLVARLQELAGSTNPEVAAEAAEMLGCVQLFIFKDNAGGQKSLRQALTLNVKRERAWDLLVLALNRAGALPELIERCSDRVTASPSVRNQVLLAKAYEKTGDFSKAEWIAMSALSVNGNDFYANLALANLIMKRSDPQSFLWRVNDCINKAAKNIGPNPTYQNHLDLALTRAIYHGLSDQPDRAREALKDMRGNSEADAVLQAIGY